MNSVTVHNADAHEQQAEGVGVVGSPAEPARAPRAAAAIAARVRSRACGRRAASSAPARAPHGDGRRQQAVAARSRLRDVPGVGGQGHCEVHREEAEAAGEHDRPQDGRPLPDIAERLSQPYGAARCDLGDVQLAVRMRSRATSGGANETALIAKENPGPKALMRSPERAGPTRAPELEDRRVQPDGAAHVRLWDQLGDERLACRVVDRDDRAGEERQDVDVSDVDVAGQGQDGEQTGQGGEGRGRAHQHPALRIAISDDTAVGAEQQAGQELQGNGEPRRRSRSR